MKEKKKVALITGVTGQDGSYLAELLLEKGYEVHGMVRRASSFNRQRLEHLYLDGDNKPTDFHVHYGDMTDSSSVIRILYMVKPDEIYNLAAQSHVQVSFEIPEYTANCDAIGVLRILESLREAGMTDVKFYQASTSELYGNADVSPQNEETPFKPVSPYGIAKLYAYWMVVHHREAYDMFACNGILFNHESERRGDRFVTKKISKAVAAIKLGLKDKLYLGNMDAKRDWGHARDYVKAMRMMLQQKEPKDYVIATGETHSVREFVELAFKNIGMEIVWKGEGVDEKGYDKETGKVYVEINPAYFRPKDVEVLLGDASLAEEEIGWKPSVEFEELVNLMVDNDIQDLEKRYLEQKGNLKSMHIDY